MKLYQIILKKLGWDAESQQKTNPAPEDKFYNPVGCKLRGVVKIDALDFRDHRFTVEKISEFTTNVGGSKHQMVDYELVSHPINGEDKTVILRMVPDSKHDSRYTHRALILSLYHEMAYDPGILEVLNNSEKNFVCDDDKNDDDPTNDVRDEYWRVNDVGASYHSKVQVLTDENRDGKAEPSKFDVEFWDYSRLTPIDGVEEEEFFFVEINKQNGWIQMWRGTEVNPALIEAF